MTTPEVPALSHLPRVQLMRTGQWDASTGTHTFTTDDLRSAVAALGCPSVRRPVLKLGHTDPRFDGEPAVGWIDNMATDADGHTLVGDYVGMPGWLGPVIASAYPDRSIEGQWDYRCALGHTHPFVVTAVALLGVEHPAIGTLSSLQDVAALFGVAASAADSGTAITVHLKGNDMPNPRPTTVAAGVTTEDVRRAYYDAAPYSVWIEEMHLDPLQLIVVDDDSGQRLRIPVAVAGDGTDGVTFGVPVPVVVRYEDVGAAPDPAADPAEVAASAAPMLRFANRAESRPGSSPRATATPTVSADGSTPEGGSPVALTLTDEQETSLREALGLAEDADFDALLTAVEELATAPAEDPAPAAAAPAPVAASAAPGTVIVDAEQFEALRVAAARGVEARDRQEADDRARLVDDAVRLGRIAPARRDHWLQALEADAGNAEVLASLAPGLIPVTEVGHAQGGEPTNADVIMASLFGSEA